MAELEAFGITTADLAASLRFYGLLGVDVPDAGEEHVEAVVPGGRLRLMWDTEDLIRQIEPDLPTPVRQRIVLAFRCRDPAEVDTTYERIVEAGFESKREPWDAFWGQRFAYLRDPAATRSRCLRRSSRHSAPGRTTGIPLESWLRGVSSVGRAPALQAGGRRFEPGTLHPSKPLHAFGFRAFQGHSPSAAVACSWRKRSR